MKALIRIISTTFVAIILLLLSAVTVLLLAPDETRKGWLVAAVGYSLNREVKIDGDFSLKIGSLVSLHASELVVSNTEWGAHPHLFRTRKLDTTLSLWPLLRGRLEFDLSLLQPELMLETSKNDVGNWRFDAAMEESSPSSLSLAIVPREISIINGLFLYHEQGIDQQDEGTIKSLHLSTLENRRSLELEGHFNDLPLLLKSERSMEQEVAPGTSSQLSIHGQIGRLNIRADGSVAGPAGRAGEPELNLAITVDSPSLRFINGQLGQALPDLGPLKGTARLQGALGTPTLKEIALYLDSPKGKLKASGEVSDILKLRGFNMEVDAATQDLAGLIKAFSLDPTLALPPSMQAAGRLSGDWPVLLLTSIDGKLADGTSHARVTGQIGNLLDLDDIAFRITLDAPTVADLSPYERYQVVDLPKIGPVTGAGRINARNGVWSASEIQVDVKNEDGWIQYKAEISDLVNWHGVDSELRAKLNSLNTLQLADLPAGAEELGQVELHLVLKEEPIGSGELVFWGEASTARLKAIAKGNFKELFAASEMTFDFELAADKLSDIGMLVDQTLSDAGPVQCSGKVLNQGEVIKLQQFQARAGSSDIAGHFAFAVSDKTAANTDVLGGKLTSDMLNLRELMPEGEGMEITVLEKQEMIKTSDDPPISADKRIFPADPLPLEQLRQYRTHIQLDAGKVITRRHLELDEVKIAFDIANDVLSAGPISARISGKPVSMEMALDASQSPAAFKLSANADDISIRHLGPAAAKPNLQNGKGSFHVDVNGQGDSLAAIMASLNGVATLGIADIRLADVSANALGVSILSKVNPVKEQGDPNALECAAVYFEIEDGMATTPRGLAAKFEEVTWLGNGKIDLTTEQIQISARPKARKGLGINLNPIADLVLLGGTLSQPQVQIDPSGVVGAYANYAAAISTGGLSLLLTSLAEKSVANEDVCMQVIEPKPANGASTPEPGALRPPAKPGEPQPAATAPASIDLLDDD